MVVSSHKADLHKNITRSSHMSHHTTTSPSIFMLFVKFIISIILLSVIVVISIFLWNRYKDSKSEHFTNLSSQTPKPIEGFRNCSGSSATESLTSSESSSASTSSTSNSPIPTSVIRIDYFETTQFDKFKVDCDNVAPALKSAILEYRKNRQGQSNINYATNNEILEKLIANTVLYLRYNRDVEYKNKDYELMLEVESKLQAFKDAHKNDGEFAIPTDDMIMLKTNGLKKY